VGAPTPSLQSQRAWQGSGRLVQGLEAPGLHPAAEQGPPRGSTPSQGHMCTKEPPEITTVPFESESPPAVGGDPHLLLALSEGPGAAGWCWPLRKAGQARRGPLLGKAGPCGRGLRGLRPWAGPPHQDSLLLPPEVAVLPAPRLPGRLRAQAGIGSGPHSPGLQPSASTSGPAASLSPSCAGASGSNAFKPPLVPPTHLNSLCFRRYIIY